MSGNWFSTGFDSVPESRSRDSETELDRFWVRVGETRNIVFLDDFSWRLDYEGQSIPIVPFCLHEHKIQMGADWKNAQAITCVKGHGPCKLCELSYKSQFVGAMTVLDITPWKKDNGEMVITPKKRLLIAPNVAIKTIESKNEKKGNLKGLHYTVARHDKKHSRCGSDFEFEEKFDFHASYMSRDDVPVNISPFGLSANDAIEYYKKLLAPPSYDALDKLVSGGSAMDGFAAFGKSPPSTGSVGHSGSIPY